MPEVSKVTADHFPVCPWKNWKNLKTHNTQGARASSSSSPQKERNAINPSTLPFFSLSYVKSSLPAL